MDIIDEEDFDGKVLIFTGPSKDKTNASLGLALRFMGHGGKVFFICSAGPQSPRLGKLGTNAMFTDHFKMIGIKSKGSDASCSAEFSELVDTARDALAIARDRLMKECELLIIDDISQYIEQGDIDIAQVLALIDSRPQNTSIIFTGTSVPEPIIRRADLVSEFVYTKQPFQNGMV